MLIIKTVEDLHTKQMPCFVILDSDYETAKKVSDAYYCTPVRGIFLGEVLYFTNSKFVLLVPGPTASMYDLEDKPKAFDILEPILNGLSPYYHANN